jgi:hypothetical protein
VCLCEIEIERESARACVRAVVVQCVVLCESVRICVFEHVRVLPTSVRTIYAAMYADISHFQLQGCLTDSQSLSPAHTPITLTCRGTGFWNCVDCVSGQLQIEGCDLSSASLTCISVRSTTARTLARASTHAHAHARVDNHTHVHGAYERI